MRKRVFALVAVCIIAVFAVSIFVWSSLIFGKGDNYNELSVVRNFNTPEEERALTVAESIDYAAITKDERFDPFGSEDYKQRKTHLSYVFANFIDTEVIKYYKERYYYQAKQASPKGVTMDYAASAAKLTHVRVYNSPGGTRDQTVSRASDFSEVTLTIPWENITIVFYDTDNSALLTTANIMTSDAHVIYKNQSEYQVLQPEFDLTFSNCYVVEMKLQYSEYYGPLAAFWSNPYQIIILDQNLSPIFIGIRPAPQAVA
jgi:hypothetical protein